ncbi:IS3 family transposase [Nocardia vinacea]|uniref:IS3 family transposase n=1 Tax=Nocardia vinacea TaxID=96468 RepID=UPI002E1064B2
MRPVHQLGVRATHPSGGTAGFDGPRRGLLRQQYGRKLLQHNVIGATRHQRWATRQELANAIFDYIEAFYSPTRRHSKIDMLSPVEYERVLPAPGYGASRELPGCYAR